MRSSGLMVVEFPRLKVIASLAISFPAPIRVVERVREVA
jgi:hypothetical protein